jgi:lauroyl/myristoyl acyltransferase
MFKKIKKISEILGEGIRILSMRVLFPFAVRTFPKRLTILLVDIISGILILLPEPGIDIYRMMRRAFGLNFLKSLALSRKWLARPLEDFIFAKRLTCQPKIIMNYKIIERNVSGVSELRKSGVSYIIACGHFAREAIMGLYLPEITPGNIFHVSLPLSQEANHIHDRRNNLQLATLLSAFPILRGNSHKIVYTGSKSDAAVELYFSLNKPGNVVIINIDAPFKIGSVGTFVRPFAGEKAKAFALGAIKLGRLCQCAVISCTCWVEGNQDIILEWGDPLRLPKQGDTEADILSINKLLDKLEIAVGRRPSQYVLEIGSDRRWDPITERWKTI